LGRAKWVGPYTEDVLAAMPGRGIKEVLVVSPSFVSDCLETLEELGHQGRHTFLRAGGVSYELVPCVNESPDFAKGLAEALRG
jgi:ferrochelatase